MKIITIAGNVGKVQDLRRTQDGTAVLSFSVAVSGYKRDDPATWFDVSLWGKRGEALAPYITKGSKVTVAGDLSTREHDGRTYLEVRASEIALQGGKPQQDRDETQSSYEPRGGAPAGGYTEDEMPFNAYPWCLA